MRYNFIASSGWLALLALILIASFASCSSSGYCRSWNDPQAGQQEQAEGAS